MNAPRFRVFSIILLISFVLHSILMIQNALEYQAHARDAQGLLFTGQIAEATKVAITNRDTITLGVLANQYAQQKNISQVQILDAQQQTLTSVGQANTRFGKIFKQPVNVDNDVIGYVHVTIYRLNRGDVISSQWHYLLGSLFIHIILLLLYQRVAMPEKKYLDKYITNAQANSFYSKPANPYYKGEVDTTQRPFDTGTGKVYTPQANQAVHDMTSFHTKYEYHTVLRIAFFDPHNLLASLTDSLALSHFQLHQTIIEKAITALQSLTLQVSQEVKVSIPKGFDLQGCYVFINGRSLDVLEFVAQLAYLYTALSKAVTDHAAAHNKFALATHCAIAESNAANVSPLDCANTLLLESAPYRIHLHCQSQFVTHLVTQLVLTPMPDKPHHKNCQIMLITDITDPSILARLLKAKNQVLSEPM